jgi:uncharacterized protein (UPF0147 family)
MARIEKSPPAATGGARELSCVAADVFESTQSQSSSQALVLGLADKVEDARRRIEEQARVLDDAISDIDVEPENVRVAAENALDTCLTLSRLLDVLDRHADFLLDLDEALRRIGGVE